MITITGNDTINLVYKKIREDSDFRKEILRFIDNNNIKQESLYFDSLNNYVVAEPIPGLTLKLVDDVNELDEGKLINASNKEELMINEKLLLNNHLDLSLLVQEGNLPIQYLSGDQFYFLILSSRTEFDNEAIKNGYKINPDLFAEKLPELVNKYTENVQSFRSLNILKLLLLAGYSKISEGILFTINNYDFFDTIMVLEVDIISNHIKKDNEIREVLKKYIMDLFIEERTIGLLDANFDIVYNKYEYLLSEIELVIPSKIFLDQSTPNFLNNLTYFRSVKIESTDPRFFKLGEKLDEVYIDESDFKKFEINSTMKDNILKIKNSSELFYDTLPEGNFKTTIKKLINYNNNILKNCKVYD